MMITNKRQMYSLLSKGELGNTTPQYFNYKDWLRSPDYYKYPDWGIRSLIPGGKFIPYVPTLFVINAVIEEYGGENYNISPMIDSITNIHMWMDVFDSDTGLQVYGIEYPDRSVTWRNVMPTKGKTWTGVSAQMMLRKHINANSYDDLMDLFERYPRHVVELSACGSCIGTIPRRNAITWEVRAY